MPEKGTAIRTNGVPAGAVDIHAFYTYVALFCVAISAAVLFIAPSSVKASINQTINFQSKIVDKTTGLNLSVGTPACVKSGADTCDFQIRIWNDVTGSSTTSGTGNLLFTQTFQDVEIGDNNGIFNLPINSCGSSLSGNSEWGTSTGTCTVVDDSDADSDPGVNFDRADLWVEVSFAPTDTSGSLGSFSEVFSRQPLRSVPSAFHAQEASSLSGFTAGNFVQLQPTAAQTAATTDALINLNETGAGTPNLLQLAVGGTNRFVVDNSGQTTANRLALWDSIPGTGSYLDISNGTNTQTSGNLNLINVVATNDSTGGLTHGIYSEINTGAANVPGILRAIRGVINYNSTGASTSAISGTSGIVNLASGSVLNANAYAANNQILNSGTANWLIGTNSYVTNQSGGLANVRIEGTETNALNSTGATAGTGGLGVFGLVGSSIFTTNDGTVNGDVLGNFNQISNTSSVVGHQYGYYVRNDNSGSIGGDKYDVFVAANDSGTITGSHYGMYVGQTTGATAGNYGLYIVGATGSGTVASLYVADGISRFAPATAGNASINIADSVATDPTTPNSGDLWWNGTNLYFFDGAINVDLLSGGGCASTCFVQNGNAFAGLATLGTTDNNDLRFIRNSGEVMRVLAGQVAINNPAPQAYATLQISATSNPVLSLEDVGNGVSYLAQDAGNGTILGAEQSIYFRTGVNFASGPTASGTDRLFIDGTTGFVGVNTTTPTQPFQIDATQTGGTTLYSQLINTSAFGTGTTFGLRSIITTDTTNTPGTIRGLRSEVNYNTSGTSSTGVLYAVTSNVQLNDGQVEDVRGGNFAVQNNNTYVTGGGGGALYGVSAQSQNYSSATSVGTISGAAINSANGLGGGGSTATANYLFGYQGDARNNVGSILNNEFAGMNQIAFNYNVVTGNFSGQHLDVRNFSGGGADGDVGGAMYGSDIYIVNDPGATGVFNDLVGNHINFFDIGNATNTYGSDISMTSTNGINTGDVGGYYYHATTGSASQIDGDFYGSKSAFTSGGTVVGNIYGARLEPANGTFGTASQIDGLSVAAANSGFISGNANGINSTFTNGSEVGGDLNGALINVINNQFADVNFNGITSTATNNTEVDGTATGMYMTLQNNSLMVNSAFGSQINVNNNGTINGDVTGQYILLDGTSQNGGDAYGIRIDNIAMSPNNNYGIYVQGANAGGANNYGIFIVGGDTAQLHIDRNAGTGIEFGAGAAQGSNDITTADGSLDIAGNVNIGGVCTDSDGGDGGVDGCDVAETFASNDNLQKGEVVKLADNVGSDWKQITRTTSKSDLAIGIISTNPTLIMGNKAFTSNRAYPVGLVGVLPTKVVNQNGMIKRGDYVTISDTAGNGMKANLGDATIGMALEDQKTPQDTINILVSRNNQELDKMSELKLANAQAGVRVNAEGKIEYRDIGGNWTVLSQAQTPAPQTPVTPTPVADSNWTNSNGDLHNTNDGKLILGLDTNTITNSKLAVSNDAEVVNGLHFLKIAAEGEITIGGYDSAIGIRVNQTTKALEFRDAVTTDWRAFTGLLLASTRVDNGVASQVTNQEVITGWGYVKGDDAALTLSDIVSFSKEFKTVPIVVINSFGMSNSEPNNLAGCTDTSTAAVQGYKVTKNDFKLDVSRSTALSSNEYYCYTWTATGPAK